MVRYPSSSRRTRGARGAAPPKIGRREGIACLAAATARLPARHSD
jgi:hypothetical protein